MAYAGITECTERYAKMKGITKKEAETRIKDILTVFKGELLDPDKEGLQFIDFLTLERVERKSKVGRNPKNPGETYEIPDRLDIKSKLGKSFKIELNS